MLFKLSQSGLAPCRPPTSSLSFLQISGWRARKKKMLLKRLAVVSRAASKTFKSSLRSWAGSWQAVTSSLSMLYRCVRELYAPLLACRASWMYRSVYAWMNLQSSLSLVSQDTSL